MEISSKAKKLLQNNYKLNSSSLKELFSSYETDGNVVIAYYNGLNELCISRGIGENVTPIGILCRVPVRYNEGEKITEGSFLYMLAADENYNTEEIETLLVKNALSDANFTCAIPENKEQYEIFKKLGFKDCKKCGFPCECDKSLLLGAEISHEGENKSKYHKILKKRSADGFTCGGLYLNYSLRRYKLGIINGAGYIVYTDDENGKVMIYDFYYPGCEDEGLEEIKKLIKNNEKVKSVIYGFDGDAESVNCFGEYLK